MRSESPHTLVTAIDVASKNCDVTRQMLVSAQRDHEQAQLQLRQLESYAIELQHKWMTRSQRQTDTSQLQCHYQFSEKLHTAIDYQLRVVEAKQATIELCRKACVEAEKRLEAFRRLQEKRVDQWRIAQKKAMQKQEDAWVIGRLRATDHLSVNGHEKGG